MWEIIKQRIQVKLLLKRGCSWTKRKVGLDFCKSWFWWTRKSLTAATGQTDRLIALMVTRQPSQKWVCFGRFDFWMTLSWHGKTSIMRRVWLHPKKLLNRKKVKNVKGSATALSAASGTLELIADFLHKMNHATILRWGGRSDNQKALHKTRFF